MAAIDKKALGSRVSARRSALGLSQAALAQAVGMKQQGVDNIENGKVARPRLLIEIAEALSTSPNWLLYGTGPETTVIPDQRSEIVARVQGLDEKKLGPVLRLLKALTDSETEAA